MHRKGAPRAPWAPGLLNAGMASQTHDSARAGRPDRGGEYSHFEHKLRERWRGLRDEARDVDPAEGTREAQETRAIELALRRIDLGTYGVCVSCGQPIEHERLDAYPTANRCAACQRVHEQDRLK